MRRISILLISACLCFCFCPLSAQVQWQESTHDFGVIFRGDPAKTTFVFQNHGEKPVSLISVKAACGCTTPTWTKAEILPGEKGKIEVKYNSDLVGEFNKGIAVKWDTLMQPFLLNIRGQVIPRLGRMDTVDMNDPFIQSMQSYKIQHTHIFMHFEKAEIGEVNSREMKFIEFPISNFSIRAVEFFPMEQDSDEVIVSFPFTKLQPGDESKIVVVVDGQKISGRTRPFEYVAKVRTDMLGNDRVLEFKTTGVFKKLYTGTEISETASILFDSAFFDAGKILEGDFIDHSYLFKNVGKSELTILDIEAECGCTAAAAESKIIPPGGSSAIKIRFDSRGRAGLMQKKIKITTNDINNPVTELELRIEVENDPFHARPVR